MIRHRRQRHRRQRREVNTRVVPAITSTGPNLRLTGFSFRNPDTRAGSVGKREKLAAAATLASGKSHRENPRRTACTPGGKSCGGRSEMVIKGTPRFLTGRVVERQRVDGSARQPWDPSTRVLSRGRGHKATRLTLALDC